MNIVVLANEISSRQTLGRLLNEAGICHESDEQFNLDFANSLTSACDAATGHDGTSVTLAWSSAVSGVDLARLTNYPGRLIVVLDPDCNDRMLQSHLSISVVPEEELTASYLRHLVSKVAV